MQIGKPRAAARASRSTTSTSATPRCTTRSSKRRCRSRALRARRRALNLKVTYQGCAEGGLCYNPITKNVSLELPPTNVATRLPADARPSASTARQRGADGRRAGPARRVAFADGNLLYACSTFFVAGLLLSLTPCVLPMIPILSGIIVGQGDKRHAAARLLARVHVCAGHGADLRRRRRDLRARCSNRRRRRSSSSRGSSRCWCCCSSRSRSRCSAPTTCSCRARCRRGSTDASNSQKSGTYIGTFIMGALSALVVTACVAPAIIAALSVISQTRQVAARRRRAVRDRARHGRAAADRRRVGRRSCCRRSVRGWTR